MAEIELICEVCGQPVDLADHSNRGIEVEPCHNCLRSAREEGREEGYNHGLAEGSS